MQRGALSDDFLVTADPTAAYYIPDFITVEEEEYLLRKASSMTQCIYVITRASHIYTAGSRPISAH